MSDEFKNGTCAPSDCASCGLDCGNTSLESHNTITLTLDDDTEIECTKQEYIALLPLDENGQNQSGEVYLYKFSRTETGDPILANIESDDEYAKAAEAFDFDLDNARKAEAAGEPLE